MRPGDLRRWNTKSNGDGTIPFLLVSIDGLDVTIMDEGETYPLSKAAVEEFSEPIEDLND